MKIVQSFSKYFGVKKINKVYAFYAEMTFGIQPGSNEHLVPPYFTSLLII